MKRWMILLAVISLGLPVAGCRVEEDDDDVELKVDTEGENKSIKIDD